MADPYNAGNNAQNDGCSTGCVGCLVLTIGLPMAIWAITQAVQGLSMLLGMVATSVRENLVGWGVALLVCAGGAVLVVQGPKVISFLSNVSQPAWIRLFVGVTSAVVVFVSVTNLSGITQWFNGSINGILLSEARKNAEKLGKEKRWEEQANELRHGIIYAKRGKLELLQKRCQEDLVEANKKAKDRDEF